jgi:hypothetical protein
MLSGVMLRILRTYVVPLSFDMLSVIPLSVVILSGVGVSVVLLGVILISDMASL